MLTELGSTWTEGRPSHSDTLECVWLLELSVTMAPGHDLPQESAHLRRVGSTLFVYVGYHCSVVCGN